ncbi:ABC transporter permease subunit [Actinoplanes sp. NEAU-A12]|uniref:ABC transporter permease subunit n=1 Tax=Actinoplanes sandaracinus TaxID=3045177 RepID=A0ABT6WGG4_9ACTN|nr:ABC transporter permease subunit [Actinoplanes sandaracinus]MDI6098818.1 ABC transporter permease subunit [Actinoplanes sandaracinus]
MSLFKAETRRLAKRRFSRYFVLGAVLVLVAVAIGMFVSNEKPTPAVIAQAQAEADRYFQEQTGYAAEEKKRCESLTPEQMKQQYGEGFTCDQLGQLQREDVQIQDFMPSQFDFRENFPGMVTTLAAILAMVAFVVGASFIGAEWNSGGMMNLLLWRPRRLQVLSTKLAALVVSLIGLTVTLSAVWTGLFWVIATMRGTTAKMTSGAWQSIGLLELRGMVLVLAAGMIGFGLASIGRHTAMALGAAIGVIVVFQFGLAVVLQVARVRFAEAYLLPFWGIAWLEKEWEVLDYNAPCDFSAVNGCEPPSMVITWQMAGIAMLAVVGLVTMAAMWTMRKRDIT